MTIPTTIDPDELCALIRDTAARYVKRPAELIVKWQPGEGNSILFGARGHADDTGQLIGRDGSHAHSIGRLVRFAGLAGGAEFGFKLITARGLDRAWFPPIRADRYDPEPVRELVGRWLKAAWLPYSAINAVCRSDVPGRLWFDLDISMPDETARDAISAVDGDPSEMSPLDALGTVIRAIGKAAGSVRLQINLR